MSAKIITVYSQKFGEYMLSDPKAGMYAIFKCDGFFVDNNSYDYSYRVYVFHAGIWTCPTSKRSALRRIKHLTHHSPHQHDTLFFCYAKRRSGSSDLVLDPSLTSQFVCPDCTMDQMIQYVRFAQNSFRQLYSSIKRRHQQVDLKSAQAKLAKNTQQTKQLQAEIDHLHAQRKEIEHAE